MKLIYNVQDRPSFGRIILFAFQQLLAIMAATIAVPAIINNSIPGAQMSQTAALFGAGVGTLVYLLFTKFKSPVFLGSSFAFIGSMLIANDMALLTFLPLGYIVLKTTKNEKYNIENVSSFSNIIAWWLCPQCGNEWETTVNHRTKEGNGCPVCSRNRGSIAKVKFHATVNNFATKYPDLAMEWHPAKNADLTANDVSVRSNKKVWWKCSFCGNEWPSTVNHRTAGGGCPKCAGKKTKTIE